MADKKRKATLRGNGHTNASRKTTERDTKSILDSPGRDTRSSFPNHGTAENPYVGDTAPDVEVDAETAAISPIVNDKVPQYIFLDTWPGHNWTDMSQPPPYSLPIGGSIHAAWECGNSHAWGRYFNGTDRKSCGGCGQPPKHKNSLQSWGLPISAKTKANKSIKDSCYLLFRTPTRWKPQFFNANKKPITRPLGVTDQGYSLALYKLLHSIDMDMETAMENATRPFVWKKILRRDANGDARFSAAIAGHEGQVRDEEQEAEEEHAAEEEQMLGEEQVEKERHEEELSGVEDKAHGHGAGAGARNGDKDVENFIFTDFSHLAHWDDDFRHVLGLKWANEEGDTWARGVWLLDADSERERILKQVEMAVERRHGKGTTANTAEALFLAGIIAVLRRKDIDNENERFGFISQWDMKMANYLLREAWNNADDTHASRYYWQPYVEVLLENIIEPSREALGFMSWRQIAEGISENA